MLGGDIVSKIAFMGGLLIDGKGGEPVQNSLLLINEKKIEYAGVMKEVEEDYKKIDVTGKLLYLG